MIDLDKDNLAEVVSENDKVFVLYGAPWCGNCRIIKPKVKKEAEQREGVQFVYVNAEKFPESRKLAQVDNLPTFASFKGGELVSQGQGNKWEAIQGVIDEIASH